MSVRVVLHPVELDHLLASREGPTGRFMQKLGMRVQDRARSLAPYDTGRLHQSIKWSWGAPEGLQRNTVLVGSPLGYAWYVENGTRLKAAQPYLQPALEEVIRTET